MIEFVRVDETNGKELINPPALVTAATVIGFTVCVTSIPKTRAVLHATITVLLGIEKI